MNRIVFFSKEDGSAPHFLTKAEALLTNLDLESRSEINDLLELYHIKLYFDSGLFLLTWNDDKKKAFIEIIKKAFEQLKCYMLALPGTDIISVIKSLDSQEYLKSFWRLINDLSIYKKIDRADFVQILESKPAQIRKVLLYKNLVEHFHNEIKSFLFNYDEAAELLLSKFEQEHRHKAPAYNFPNSLSNTDKENIIEKYIDGENANLNYLQLIEQSKESNDLKLSPKTRLKAKKKSEALNNEILESTKDHLWCIGVDIGLDSGMKEFAEYSYEGDVFRATYSRDYLDTITSDTELFQVFGHPFCYIDEHGLATLVNKESEMDVMERIFMKSKNAYPDGIVFKRKAFLAQGQIVLLNNYLNPKKNSVEQVVSSFITQHLNIHYRVQHLRFRPSGSHLSFLEKIRVLAPEFESLLRQYEAYVNDGSIDFELLELNSTPIRLGEIRSLVSKKYIYANSKSIDRLLYLFFSDQSSLYYTDKYEDKYTNLYDLLKNENVNITDFESYQQYEINKLIEEDYLSIGADNTVSIKKETLLYIVSKLYKDEVLNYWHHKKPVRDMIDELINEKQLVAESSLFTRQEISFYNYYLNKKEFTNGIDLRNRYLHGSNSPSEKEHQSDYYILMKLIILTTLKIENDLLINDFAAKHLA
ncbi:hypothetical protein U0035_02700 [Niabella yanshanensis]|uniref:Apea-like HEPN domain-containing protein n=1 Tax=Niabella yanshanensis TaxID=577386 RepID=A0ABZ0WAF6_9BACT|nr:hypothetical protein [Niabella yanshanensis]WQD39056.1 hypothetical protein U0035_02700 [Niabella yanshanensis]